MPDTQSAVEAHYSRSDLGETILEALKQAGKDVDHLTVEDLAPIDEFHTRQRTATVELVRLLNLTGTERVLDVGCGIGGPSRFLAKEYGCHVTGLGPRPSIFRRWGFTSSSVRISARWPAIWCAISGNGGIGLITGVLERLG